MENKVHTFTLSLDWKLIRLISQIDRFDASWTLIEKREGQSLKQLKTIATVRSVGASTRIEGSKMSDEEVEVLLKEIDITKIVDIAAVPGFAAEIQPSIFLFCYSYRGITERLCSSDLDIIDAEFFTDVFYMLSINHKMVLSVTSVKSLAERKQGNQRREESGRLRCRRLLAE